MTKILTLTYLLLIFYIRLFSVNDRIYSQGSSSVETLATFLSNGNRDLGEELVVDFATIYVQEATVEGINWDVAFVQMCLETGYLKYGGLVVSEQNNFCGLGSFNSKQGASFPTIREGVRAHIQHLKAYSSTDKLVGTLLDPRFNLVTRGSAVSAVDLAGTWAEDPKYGTKLISLLNRVAIIESGDLILKAENSELEVIPEPSGWLR